MFGTVLGLGSVLAVTPPQLGPSADQGPTLDTVTPPVQPAVAGAAPCPDNLVGSAGQPLNATDTMAPGWLLGDTDDDDHDDHDDDEDDDKDDEGDEDSERSEHEDNEDEAGYEGAGKFTPIAVKYDEMGLPCLSGSPSVPGATPATPTKVLSDGTFTGAKVDTRYGPIQVRITVVEGRITAVDVPAFPRSDGRSQQISSWAVPKLVTSALQVQTGTVQGVSGASYTAEGFRRSLAAAIADGTR